MTRPACTSSCDQGRKPCPCPMACQLPESRPRSMLASRSFWIAAAVSLLMWAVVIGLAVLVYMRVTQ